MPEQSSRSDLSADVLGPEAVGAGDAIIQPGAGIVFMKVGTHAREPLTDIIVRKKREIDEAGYALWGYGGNTCHPVKSVQPFAQSFVRRGGAIYLVMQPMQSRHFATPERAREFSPDGKQWEKIPQPISVLGSNFALALDSLEEEAFDFSLGQTRVAVGSKSGRRGDRYIKGRVDKACLELVEESPDDDDARIVHVGLVARLVEPYAVFVRT